MSTINTTNYGTVNTTSSPKVMGISNFTKWVKVAILRKPPNPNHNLYRSTKVRSSIKRSVSTNKVFSSTNSPLPKSRNSIRQKSNKLITFHDKNEKILINEMECADDNSWVDQEELLDKDEMIIPGLKSALSDMYEVPAGISNKSPRQQTFPNNDSNDVTISRVDYLENTNIVKGSAEHYVYLRSIRKLRVGKRPILSAILAGVHKSPISMKYRPSYASSKVVTVFNDELNQLVVKELPMARRRKRLNSLSNTLVRSTSSSSSSTNSSQSSLTTLTDQDEQQKYSSTISVFWKRFASLKNFISSVEDNVSSHMTLAV
ncbi:5921_t:CDS:2 [Funneliformis geosporum]|nr:5921_t:CDS:2 [Funneliformis geosporum]